LGTGEELRADGVHCSDHLFQAGRALDEDRNGPPALPNLDGLPQLKVGKYIIDAQHEPSPVRHN
jgi:hypothetical protein